MLSGNGNKAYQSVCSKVQDSYLIYITKWKSKDNFHLLLPSLVLLTFFLVLCQLQYLRRKEHQDLKVSISERAVSKAITTRAGQKFSDRLFSRTMQIQWNQNIPREHVNSAATFDGSKAGSQERCPASQLAWFPASPGCPRTLSSCHPMLSNPQGSWLTGKQGIPRRQLPKAS